MGPRGLADIVRELGGRLEGPDPGDVAGVAPPDEAPPGHLTLYVDARLRPALGMTRAAAALTDEAHATDVLEAGLAAWIHEAPARALAGVLNILHPEEAHDEPAFDPALGASVSRSAELGPGVTLSPGCVIHDGASLGEASRVGENAVVCHGARLGPGCVIGAGAWIGPGTSAGGGLVLGPGAVIGSDGFGLRQDSGEWIAIRHVGRVVIGDDVSIGPRSVVARGTLGTTLIGDGTKVDAQVHIGHNVRIGRRCAIAAQVGIAGSTTIGDDVMIGGQAGIADHLRVGDGARIAARSGVAGDVAAGATVEGYPAVDRWTWLRMMALLKKNATDGS